MTLKQTNPHLKSPAVRKAALRISAQTSSAVESIHAPFAKSDKAEHPANTGAFIAYWRKRVASTAR